MAFEFLDYKYAGGVAEFRYLGKDNTIFVETTEFETSESVQYDEKILDAALFLAFVVIGTSYYKAEPTVNVKMPTRIDEKQAEFFDKIYQEGLSQFAFENNLTRADLAHFAGDEESKKNLNISGGKGSLALVSGGKDSLLTVEKTRLSGEKYRVAYITAQKTYPEIIDEFESPVIIRRKIDKENLKKVGGMNGHVPVTLINEALALVQAILLGLDRVEVGVGREGVEPHAKIGDLLVNHQWAKTEEAQKLMSDYVRNYVAEDLTVGSSLAEMDELTIAREFARDCWDKYGDKFSSCNVANYKQDADNRTLKWCGKCAKCANSYLLFAPFVPYEEQKKIFGRDLFEDPELTETFKGLLGIDGVMKPFECVASTDELRWAYDNRLPGYGKLPFLK